MRHRTNGLSFAALLAVAVVVAACNPMGAATPTPTVCDGVSSEVGGCDASLRHTFVGSTCAALAEEWAAVLDKAVVSVLRGPETVANNGRSVRLRQVLVITTGDMNIHLRELGLAADCDVPAFMAVAEPQFSPELRAGVGDALFDGNPAATYDEWLADVGKVIRMIDQNE